MLLASKPARSSYFIGLGLSEVPSLIGCSQRPPRAPRWPVPSGCWNSPRPALVVAENAACWARASVRVPPWPGSDGASGPFPMGDDGAFAELRRARQRAPTSRGAGGDESMTKRDDADANRARPETIRQSLRAALRDGPYTAHELSALVSVSEAAVAKHLEHLARSIAASGDGLVVEPARCLECGHAFRDRRRLSTPGRCPRCRSERISPPRFSVSKRSE